MKRLLIIFYTGKGSTERMAEAIGEGAESPEIEVEIKRVEDCVPEEMAEASGIVMGSPTYFSNVAWQVKKLIDESHETLYRQHRLEGRVFGCFTSSGTPRDGRDCVRALELAFGFHHRMKRVPGIVRARRDKWEKIIETCRQYGKEMARQVLSTQRP